MELLNVMGLNVPNFPAKKMMRKRMMIRYIGSFETPEEYTMIGVWAFTEKGIDKKLKRLKRSNIFPDEIVPLRKVDEFPDYITWRV